MWGGAHFGCPGVCWDQRWRSPNDDSYMRRFVRGVAVVRRDARDKTYGESLLRVPRGAEASAVASIMAEHSMCQPGRPSPQGLGHLGSLGLLAFHSAKSLASRLRRGAALDRTRAFHGQGNTHTTDFCRGRHALLTTRTRARRARRRRARAQTHTPAVISHDRHLSERKTKSPVSRSAKPRLVVSLGTESLPSPSAISSAQPTAPPTIRALRKLGKRHV